MQRTDGEDDVREWPPLPPYVGEMTSCRGRGRPINPEPRSGTPFEAASVQLKNVGAIFGGEAQSSAQTGERPWTT